jgi:hypothetical protein
LITPALGTPSSGTLTSCTGLPISTGLTGAGTGVLAALAINVGSAGAFVTFNGAGGTPSAITLTNGTGLPIAGIAGLGTGVPTALNGTLNASGGLVGFSGALGTPSSGVATNLTGTAASLTAGNVTTNANLTGVITSVGNATSIASQTGTGTKFVVDTSPTLTGTPLAPTAAVDTNTTQIATTAMVLGQASAVTPLAATTAGAVGTSTRYARADHVHPASSTNTQLLFASGNLNPVTQNATWFFTNGGVVSTEAVCQIPMSQSGTLQKMYVAAGNAPAAGQTYTFTARKNGVDTALTCQVTSAGATANDTTHSVSYAAGDLLSIKLVTSATSGTANGVNCGLQFVTTSP